MQPLTDRQEMILQFIRRSIRERGYPPTLREIGARMGIRSTNGVNDHLRALERKGYLTREDMKSRALRPATMDVPLPKATSQANDAGESNGHGHHVHEDERLVEVPVVGRVAAGVPILAEQNVVDEIGAAMGIRYEDNEELKVGEKERERDIKRWELDPASSEDYKDRK